MQVLQPATDFLLSNNLSYHSFFYRKNKDLSPITILGYAMIHEYRMYLDDHYKARYSFRDFIKRERFYIYLFFASIFIFLTNLFIIWSEFRIEWMNQLYGGYLSCNWRQIFIFTVKKMNDMINYLTTKNRLLVAILAFILPFSFARAEVKEDGRLFANFGAHSAKA